jgi:hypothetical protein
MPLSKEKRSNHEEPTQLARVVYICFSAAAVLYGLYDLVKVKK